MARRALSAVAMAAVLAGASCGEPPPPAAAPAAAPTATEPDVEPTTPLERKRRAYGEKMRANGWLPFRDLEFGTDLRKAGDSRWAETALPLSPEGGDPDVLQFAATWSPDPTEGPGVTVTVHRYAHLSSDGTSKLTLDFPHAGLRCDTSDDERMLSASYLDTTHLLRDVEVARCVAPKRRRCGPADRWASVVGSDPESGKRIRLDWWSWTSPNVTWIARAETASASADSEDVAEKVVGFLRSIKELKPPTR